MNTVVNKLGFGNGKMRLKSAYRRQKSGQFILHTSAFELLSVSDGHKIHTVNTIKKRNLKQIAFF